MIPLIMFFSFINKGVMYLLSDTIIIFLGISTSFKIFACLIGYVTRI